MISPNIQSQIGDAMKSRDEVRLSTLRMLLSELRNEKIKLMHDLSEDEELGVVRREVKKRKDSIDAYKKAAREDLASREELEMKVLQDYLPADLSDDELGVIVENVISELGAKGMADVGKVIGAVLAKAAGRADGSRVSVMVREKLQ